MRKHNQDLRQVWKNLSLEHKCKVVEAVSAITKGRVSYQACLRYLDAWEQIKFERNRLKHA